MVDLKVLIEARGVNPVSRKRHDLIEQWNQVRVALDRDKIEVPAWTDEDDSELHKWRTLDMDDVTYAAVHAVEAALDETLEAKLRFNIASTFDLGSASDLIQNFFRSTRTG
jgi:hypothetical protein